MQTTKRRIDTAAPVLQTSARVRFGAIATSNVTLKMNVMLRLGAISNVHDW
jgi:hypothetical protein